MKKIIILIIILLVLWGGYSYFNRDTTQNLNEIPSRGDEIMCTMDARMCPDGSYVGRQAPDCKFQICPDGSDVNEQAPELIQ